MRGTGDSVVVRLHEVRCAQDPRRRTGQLNRILAPLHWDNNARIGDRCQELDAGWWRLAVVCSEYFKRYGSRIRRTVVAVDQILTAEAVGCGDGPGIGNSRLDSIWA